MPIYEYLCDGCGHQFEEIQRITDPPVELCPQCGKHSARRLISRTSFILKGSGWYATDYGRTGGSSAGAGSKEPAAGSAGSGSDSSPAAGSAGSSASSGTTTPSPTPSSSSSSSSSSG